MQDWLEPLIKIALVVGALMTAVAYLVLIERKAAAYLQDRLGPNRVGPWGLFQPIADGAKFILKEEIVPAGADKVLFLLAPVMILATAMLAFATIPFGYLVPWEDGETIELTIAPSLDIGLVLVFAISSLGVYGVVVGGWASNSKYSFLGALRSSAQLISYEIPLGLSVIGLMLYAGSLRMETIVTEQARTGWWWIALQPLAFLVFMISGCAESTRLPFDLPECEQELVAGYHSEYTGMKFGMFAFAEYLHMITVAFLAVLLFFGGWHLWFLAPFTKEVTWLGALVRVVVLSVKVLMMIFFFMWIRWSWPRFRYDQLMDLAWKAMIPLGVVNLIVCAVCQEFLRPDDMFTRCILGWLAVIGCIVYAAFSAKPAGSKSRVAGEPGT
ncbi:MAG TPA: NADH-quinone oxidoreductase subunit NuoH [Planctomycetaceae bacterium]|jgi:NADH-quinone oxidoreductase subunit H|nr:NADH-quinone oxidoreductase subunit NuoH [Planctomycetaceae bacterium]